MEYFDTIPVSMIRQYCFCPRVVYYAWILGHKPAMPKWVKQGEQYHLRTQMLNRRRNLSRYQLDSHIASLKHDVSLYDDLIGLHGVCDACIELDNAVVPLEFKLDLTRVHRGQIMQVVGYGVLLESKFSKPCKVGFILHGEKGKTYQIEITEKLKFALYEIINAIKNMQETTLLPNSSASDKQCVQCEFLNLCNDRF